MEKEIMSLTVDHMKKALEHLDHELATIRTGRASAALLDSIKVDYYGTMTPLKHVATINIPDSKTLSIQPFESNKLHAIEKAILASDLGITPNNDGHSIRLSIPKLTEERRKDLLKIVKRIGEESKVAVRNVRRDAIEKLKAAEKDDHITEDDLHRSEKEVQEITDKNISEIDRIIELKDKEIMTV